MQVVKQVKNVTRLKKTALARLLWYKSAQLIMKVRNLMLSKGCTGVKEPTNKRKSDDTTIPGAKCKRNPGR